MLPVGENLFYQTDSAGSNSAFWPFGYIEESMALRVFVDFAKNKTSAQAISQISTRIERQANEYQALKRRS